MGWPLLPQQQIKWLTGFSMNLDNPHPKKRAYLVRAAYDRPRQLLTYAFGFRALTPTCWVELCLSGGQLRRVFYEVLCCPHASDYTADAFLVANPVVLKALWSGGESCRFHALYLCCSKR